MNIKPFQGLRNVLRFNRRHYLLGLFIVTGFVVFAQAFPAYSSACLLLALGGLIAILFSLLGTLWAYDLSGLYTLTWSESLLAEVKGPVVLIHAGFDELSPLLKEKYTDADILVWDMFDSHRQTETSIRIAKEESVPTGGLSVSFDRLPMRDGEARLVLLPFSAHELRRQEDRTRLLLEVRRILSPGAKIVMMEHLRDFPNFIAYTIGFLHFHSFKSWKRSFDQSGLILQKRPLGSPFIHLIIAERNGDTF